MTSRAARIAAALAVLALAGCAGVGGGVGPAPIWTSSAGAVMTAERAAIGERWFLYVDAETPGEDAQLRAAASQALEIVDSAAKAQRLAPQGGAVIDRLRRRGDRFEFRVGRFFDRAPREEIVGVKAVRFEAGEIARFVRSGAVAPPTEARRAMGGWLAENNLLPVGSSYLELGEQPGRWVQVQPVAQRRAAPGA